MLDARLDAALADDSWQLVSELAADPPGGRAALARRIGERFSDSGEDEQRRLSYLLGLLGEDGAPILLELLDRHRSADLLSTAVQRGLTVPAPTLDALVERLGYMETVVDALGLSGDLSRAGTLGDLLRDDRLCGRAALALARLGAREWTVPIARRLWDVDGPAHSACAVALGELGDPAAVPVLLDWLARGPDLPAGEVHLALCGLTGRDPLLPECDSTAQFNADARRAWSGVDLTVPPRPEVRDVVLDSPRRLRFSLDEGRGRVRIDYDPPSPGSSWPRWNKTLHVGEHPLYRVSSDCGTCETIMGLLGFPPAEARSDDARVRAVLADPRELTGATVRALEPVIHELATGHYGAYLVDLALERVAQPQDSWWLRRVAARDDPDEWLDANGAGWPGIEHFQTPRPIPAALATYCSILPSQPLDALDAATVRRHASAIEDGERPAALVLAWTEDRYVQAEWEERFLVGVVLDGHHRLAAYAAAGIPARALIIAPETPQDSLPEVIDAL